MRLYKVDFYVKYKASPPRFTYDDNETRRVLAKDAESAIVKVKKREIRKFAENDDSGAETVRVQYETSISIISVESVSEYEVDY